MPIAELGIECIRERTPMTPFPAPNRLHVWWARRPLVASRAAILASLLPAGADKKKFLYVLGIHGDPLAARQRIAEANRNGERLGSAAYGYPRAFKYTPTRQDLDDIEAQIGRRLANIAVLDPTAGGGAIPFEASRLGAEIIANELNPVAALILTATVLWPKVYEDAVLPELKRLGAELVRRSRERLAFAYPPETEPNRVPDGYLWARTIRCPYCDGLVPLSPNWRVEEGGTGVRLSPQTSNGPNSPGRVCRFEIVRSASEQSAGTMAGGDAVCPFPDCSRVIDGNEIKRQARAGEMGDQLFVVIFRQRSEKRTRAGKTRVVYERHYRAPDKRDDVLNEVNLRLQEKLPIWEARDIIPSEPIPEGLKTEEPIRYGMTMWRDLFNVRQLYAHCSSVEIYRELLDEEHASGELAPATAAAFGYLALAVDKLINYNCRSGRWDNTILRIRSMFDTHNFALVWSYAEMAPLVAGLGYDWALEQTALCVEELVELTLGAGGTLLSMNGLDKKASISVTCGDAARISSTADSSVDSIVIDPPYYDNVMYSELSDFFYVWLKRTAGLVYPQLFRSPLTDKEHEAVANPARYEGQRGAKALAAEDYRHKMAAIFADCRRVLKPDGIMTLMFTHKATGAWDALAKGLIEAGFVITASWPINTESEASLHIRNKAAANSTVFLVCRPRTTRDDGSAYWDDLEREVRQSVRRRIGEFQEAGIRGVDLYLASFGPALEVLSRHWPVQRVTPRPDRVNDGRARRRSADDLIERPLDPYEVTPEDALDAARAEVKRWRLEQLSKLAAREGLDPVTSWFVLAWDAFESAVFPYDEALRLARVCGVSLDDEIVKRYATKKGDNLTLMDSGARAAKHVLGPPDGTRSLLDAVHHAAYLARTRSLAAARDLLEEHHLVRHPAFVAAFDAMRQVLPVSQEYSGEALPAVAAGAGDDFRALEDLRKLLYATELPPPHQLELRLRS